MATAAHPKTFSDLRVLIVEHEPTCDPALVGERLALSSSQVTLYSPGLAAELPSSLDGFDAFIVLGGSMGPLEDEKAPWLPGVRALLTEAIEREIPTLGVCLGAQLLAATAGSTVAPIDDGPEIGLIPLTLTQAGKTDPLLGGLANTPIRAVEWHWLEAKSLPNGATPLITSAACANQAFRVGERAWGLQFHLEALPYTVRNWSDENEKELAELQIDPEADIISVVADAEPELRSTWSTVIDRWIALAAEARQPQR